MKALKIIGIILFSILAGLYLYFYAAAPIITVSKLNGRVTSDTVFMKKHKSMANFPKLLPEIKEKSFLEAQLSLAKRDSIGIVINLKDSTVSLVMKGVTIRSSKMLDYKKDRVLDGINGPAYYKYFSNPLTNVSEYCSMIKEPIEKKTAPKDTIEALKHLIIPDSVACEPAYYSATLSNGLNLIMVQSVWETEAEKEIEKKFKSDMNHQKFLLGRIKGLAKKEGADYKPTILIKLSKYDIRAIYRGTPWKPGIVIYY